MKIFSMKILIRLLIIASLFSSCTKRTPYTIVKALRNLNLSKDIPVVKFKDEYKVTFNKIYIYLMS